MAKIALFVGNIAGKGFEMFLTEADLQRLKQTRGKYFNLCLADIFVQEISDFDNLIVSDLYKAISHRLIDEKNNIWEVDFSDGSFILHKIMECSEKIKVFPPFHSGLDVNYYFND